MNRVMVLHKKKGRKKKAKVHSVVTPGQVMARCHSSKTVRVEYIYKN